VPTYTPDQVDQIVQYRLERLRDTWKQEREDLWAERDGLRQQVAELEAELAAFRRASIGTGTPLRDGE
jgi:hypothetical protein